MQEQYDPNQIETETQQFYQDKNAFHVTEDASREKFYCLSMFPYPSGNLHMGHVRNYTIGDVISRYQRMLGKNVMQPMGFDAFGLPAENAAIKHGIQPSTWTRQNIAHIRSQMKRMGFAYDWQREIATCDPEYYKWEQWLFLQMVKKGLAYRKESAVNWDPVDQTVLANEQVVNGRGWRSGAPIERRFIPQWFLKITDYADELLRDLDQLPHWPQQVVTMQRNWIGRSTGVEMTFFTEHHEPITIYTTRIDTLFGASFIAIAPEHPLVEQYGANNPDIQAFVDKCKHTKVAEAELATMEKQGIALGIDAIHPITQERMPIWIANFVVMDYGTGALMAVPAHDERDFEFAQKYQLPIRTVIQFENQTAEDMPQTKAMIEKGVLVHSGDFSGLHSNEAMEAIAEYLAQHGLGQKKVQYRLRDWSISRQRYWGAPIPIIYCDQCGTVPVPESDLPVLLPEDVKLDGSGSPLKHMPSFYEVNCPTCGAPAKRETDTFDTFIESSWYYARFACVAQQQAMLDGRANYWLSVDQYIGGIEHAVLHLLYARFFHKVLRDLKLLNSDEPFTRLLSQGMVLNKGAKMSKSLGNTVDPQAMIDKYGADTVRLFIIFAAPPEQSLEWSDSGVEGANRFLRRLWSYCYNQRDIIIKENRLPTSNQLGSSNWEDVCLNQLDIFRKIYLVLDQAKFDYERQQYNTVVSACMKILNFLTEIPNATPGTTDINDIIVHKGISILLRLLAPITPHITHRLWLDLSFNNTLIIDADWPKSSPITFKMESIELVVQVNGKLRSRLRVPQQANQSEIESLVRADERVASFIKDAHIRKIVHVPGKLVNLVVE